MAGEFVLDSLQLGVVFLAAAGKTIYANRAAETIFRGNDGLTVRNGSLCATGVISNEALHQAIGRALAPGDSAECPPKLLVERNSMRQPYQLVVAPFRRRFSQFVGTEAPAAVVLITDPEQEQSPPLELLRTLYKLTRREAQLATKLCEGKALDQSAEELHIGYETARTHLRRIFGKTGTSRQAELVKILGRLVTPASLQ